MANDIGGLDFDGCQGCGLQRCPSRIPVIVLALCLVVVSLTGCLRIPVAVGLSVDASTPSAIGRFSKSLGCRGGWVRPIRIAGNGVSEPTKGFKRPAHPWLPAHRGVDLSASPDALILAPEQGTIAFIGTVGGKAVVTIRHKPMDDLTSTFEPASTDLRVGDRVGRGDVIGVVKGHSDHCDGACLHWGLRTSDGDYLNPMHMVVKHRIGLKPV